MINIVFTATFLKQLKKSEKKFQDEVVRKSKLFEDIKNHKNLKVHKLHGRLKDFYSFSIDFKQRIIFRYETSKEVYFMSIESHDGYRK